ncbi:hypothetical protein BFP70_08745 [Thioclava sp. SK-1]|uniref:hypothetical protein n=1 Tax=Thioclava sp. SK-1 TaxID=1889770 RepID=UPI0008251211|nr:hypothetical protein [Thioclava sp. SK-1]OCX65693.1 hypothetical protein BFP70_08745 [Thioclava sp. SK-1]
MTLSSDQLRSQHDALHLAYRWFAFFEAPGSALAPHLEIFDPQVSLSGHQGRHLFADDRDSLATWFATVPGERSAHHILHATFEPAPRGQSRLNMLVAYQAVRPTGVQGAIIRYETELSHRPEGARFLSLDKTPILPDTQAIFAPSWAANRVLALAHAALAELLESDARLREALGAATSQLQVQANVPEGSPKYRALLSATDTSAAGGLSLFLDLEDDVSQPLPAVSSIIPAERTAQQKPLP